MMEYYYSGTESLKIEIISLVQTFRFLKNEIPISCLPVVDDIVIVACALCNLLDPLC